jgi:hypothetical protein
MGQRDGKQKRIYNEIVPCLVKYDMGSIRKNGLSMGKRRVYSNQLIKWSRGELKKYSMK